MNRLLPIGILVLFGCAQIVAPTGGPKDVEPPVILSETPSNLSTNFTSKQVVISFDEFIQLNSPAEQILISPPMRKSPTYTLRKKSLVIKFEDELTENTTYTINFGEAIKDNNEGNVLKNYTYVFSTGAVLDSMELKGNLLDAITGDAIDNALVMLYKENVDSLPLDTIPDYFTRANNEGRFVINHIANQSYKIFALKDENANYRFDVPTEQIGFIDSLVVPDSPIIQSKPDTTKSDSLETPVVVPSRHEYELTMFVEEDTSQFLKKAFCEHYGKLVFSYNRPVGKFNASIQGVDFKRQWAIKEFGSNRDTIILWTTDLVPDTLTMIVQADGGPVDTVDLVMKDRSAEIKTGKRGKGIGEQTKKFALTLNTDPPKNRAPKPKKDFRLIWSHPILNMDLSRVKLYEDSVRVKYNLNSADSALRKFDLQYEWKKGKRYELHIADSAFTDLFGLWNDTIDVSFVGTDKDMFGKLSLKIIGTPKDQLVIELLNMSNKVIQTRICNSKGLVVFDQLDPAKYNVRVVRDWNANGKWDTGRYADHLQPEPIKVIQRDSEVRANWDLELEWNPNE